VTANANVFGNAYAKSKIWGKGMGVGVESQKWEVKSGKCEFKSNFPLSTFNFTLSTFNLPLSTVVSPLPIFLKRRSGVMRSCGCDFSRSNSAATINEQSSALKMEHRFQIRSGLKLSINSVKEKKEKIYA
jgi:hypothetical protein